MKMNTRALAQILSALILSASLMGVLPHAFAQADATNVVIVGMITEANDASLTVNGLAVDVSQAQIDANVTLAVGEIVQVEGVWQTDGSIAATVVSLPGEGLLPDEVEVVGLLTSLDTTTAVVNGIVFDITQATVDAQALPGAIVRVFATPDMTTNVWVARTLELVDEGFSADMAGGLPCMDESFHIVGTVDEVGDAYIVVSGLMLDTTNAEFNGTPVVGALVSVHVQVVDGVLVAVEVDATDDVWGHLETMCQEREQHQEQHQERHQEGEQGGEHEGQGQADSGQCGFEVEVSSANLRGGPGTGYEPMGFALEGEHYPVTGMDATGGWLQVQTPFGAAWMAASVGDLDDCYGLPIVDMPYMEEHHEDWGGQGGFGPGDHNGGEHEHMGEGFMPGFDDNPMGESPCSFCDDFMDEMHDGHED